jgi:hypothetical protein
MVFLLIFYGRCDALGLARRINSIFELVAISPSICRKVTSKIFAESMLPLLG